MIKRQKSIPKYSKKGLERKEAKKSLLNEDRVFYQKIWDKRPHVCFNCGKSLGVEPLTLYFDHILEKGNKNYAHLRHEERNICLVCWDCHNGKEHLPKLLELREQTKKYFNL